MNNLSVIKGHYQGSVNSATQWFTFSMQGK